MKLYAVVASSIVLAAAVPPSPALAGPIGVVVRIENVTPGRGHVRVAMFTEGQWLTGAPVAVAQVAANADSASLQISAPDAGVFGLTVYQDVNGDGRLNRNIVGMPTEPYAFSNNARAAFGPPRFAAAALEIQHPTTMTITLR